MYVPPKFKVEDSEVISSFIKENSFGLLLTVADSEIHDTHTPFVLANDGRLIGHIAVANPQWKSWGDGTKAKVIFTGAHTYISPSYYASDFNVPTWNYTAVSVSGKLTVIDDEAEILEFLDTLVAQNETNDCPWSLDRQDERYMKLLSGIVVFSVEMEKVEASFKLSQNKAEEDRNSVVSSLGASGCPFDHSVAEMMKKIKENSREA